MVRSKTREKSKPGKRSKGKTGDADGAVSSDGRSSEHEADAVAEDGELKLFSLEEVSEVSGLAPRTIRYYQTKKLLPRTIKDPTDGRVARYSDEHVQRLRLIGELHDRGLKLPAIRELFDSSDPQARVSDWLGLNESLGGSWSGEAPRLLGRGELDDLLAQTPPGTLGTLERREMVVRQGDSWLVRNPALFELTLNLVADDVTIDLVLDAGDILQKHLNRASTELIDLFVSALDQGFGGGAEPGPLVQSLRPVAGDAARMIFARELERAIQVLLADTKRLS